MWSASVQKYSHICIDPFSDIQSRPRNSLRVIDAVETKTNDTLHACPTHFFHAFRVQHQQIALFGVAVEHDTQKHSVVLRSALWIGNEYWLPGTVSLHGPVRRPVRLCVVLDDPVIECAQSTIADTRERLVRKRGLMTGRSHEWSRSAVNTLTALRASDGASMVVLTPGSRQRCKNTSEVPLRFSPT